MSKVLEQILEANPRLVVEIANGISTWNIRLKYPQGADVRSITYSTIEGGIERLHGLLLKEAQEQVDEAQKRVDALALSTHLAGPAPEDGHG